MESILAASGAKHTSALDLDEIASGSVVRLLIEIVENGLGQAIRVPVMVAKGTRPGPVLGATAALHGNEINGIPVLHHLFENFSTSKLRGTLVAVVVANVPGFLLHQRQFNDEKDLNSLMPGKPDGNMAQVYAHRLIERVVSRFDYLVDLHTASFGRINSYYVRADMSKPKTRQMALLQRPQIILHDPPSDYTLRGAAEDLDIPAITMELRDPQRFQRDVIKKTMSGMRRLLAELGMLGRVQTKEGHEPIVCRHSRWLYTDRGGLIDVLPEVASVVEEGEVVAVLRSIFGDVVRQYRAPYRGAVIGKSSNPVAQTGARILHLGAIVPDNPPLSEEAP